MRVDGPTAVVINDSVEDASNAFSRRWRAFKRRHAPPRRPDRRRRSHNVERLPAWRRWRL